MRALTADAAESPAVPVTVAADRGPVTLDVATSGTVQPATTRSLSFTVDGAVTKVSVRPGSKVTAGQALAAVDDASAATTVDEARDSLREAEDQLTAARTAAETAARTSASASACPTRAGGTDVAAAYRWSPDGASGREEPSYTHGSPVPEDPPGDDPPGDGPPGDDPPADDPPGDEPPVQNPPPPPVRTTPPAATRTPNPTRTSTPPRRPAGSNTTPTGCPTRTATTPGNGANGNGTNGGGANGGGANGGGGADPVLSAQQRVNQADAALEQAEDALEGATITSPIAGTVLSVAGKVGSQVGRGSAFITVADTFAMQVDADFPEADAGSLAVRQPATVTLADGGGREVTGTVVRVDPVGTSDGTMVRYGVVVSFTKAPGDLLVGQSAAVKVRTGDVADAVRVPSTAVHDVAGGSGTVLVRTGTASATRTVGVGLRGDQYTEITSGLDAGTAVVRSW